jgi:hypothetical protein
MNGKIYIYIKALKSISGVTFLFGNLANCHFFGKFCSRCTHTSPTGSNDTGLKNLVLPGAESIAIQTDIFGYYNIRILDKSSATFHLKIN